MYRSVTEKIVGKIRALVTAFLFLSILLSGCRKSGSPDLIKLNNGFTTITQVIPGRKIATVLLAVRAGSIYENENINGISLLISKILFRESEKYKNIKKEIDAFGGRYYSTTRQDFTIYSITLQSDYVDEALTIFRDALINPVITDSIVTVCKKEMLSELESDEKNPRFVLMREFLNKAFTVHPYKLYPKGTQFSINKLSYADVRNYFTSLYTPSNMTLVIVGDFHLKSILQKCRNNFENFERKPVMQFSYDQEPVQRKPREAVIRSKAAQGAAVVSVGWHSPGIRSRDTYAMDILLQTLGVGISSRLNCQLTEEMPDVFWTWGSYVTSREPGCFVLNAVCSISVAQKVKTKILKEVEVVRRDSITPRELEKAKMYFIAEAAYDLESTLDSAYSLAFWSINKDFNFAETYLPNIKKVTIEDVKRVAQKYLKPDSYTSVVLYPEK